LWNKSNHIVFKYSRVTAIFPTFYCLENASNMSGRLSSFRVLSQRKFNSVFSRETFAGVLVVRTTRKKKATRNRQVAEKDQHKEHIMGSKLHGTLSAVLMSSAIVMASASFAVETGGNAAAGANVAAPARSADENPSAGGGADIAAITAGVGKTSTPQRVANASRASKARVESREEEITRELNRASAASAGNAPASAQATVGQPGTATINETGAPAVREPIPPAAQPSAPASEPSPPAIEPAAPTVGEPGTAVNESAPENQPATPPNSGVNVTP
jgi:hypothetical protein